MDCQAKDDWYSFYAEENSHLQLPSSAPGSPLLSGCKSECSLDRFKSKTIGLILGQKLNRSSSKLETGDENLQSREHLFETLIASIVEPEGNYRSKT